MTLALTPQPVGYPPGQDAANLTAVTVFASNVMQVIYLGRFDRPLSSIDILCRTTTAYVAGTYAEVAIYQGPIGTLGAAPASLTRLGFTSVATTFNGAAGIYKTTVALSGMGFGVDLWCVLGSQNGTQFQCRGVLADDIQSGRFCTFTGRPSTNSPISPTIGGAAAVPIWLAWGGAVGGP